MFFVYFALLLIAHYSGTWLPAVIGAAILFLSMRKESYVLCGNIGFGLVALGAYIGWTSLIVIGSIALLIWPIWGLFAEYGINDFLETLLDDDSRRESIWIYVPICALIIMVVSFHYSLWLLFIYGFLLAAAIGALYIFWQMTLASRAAAKAVVGAIELGVEVVQNIVEIARVIINSVISLFTIREQVNIKCPSALKGVILEKKKSAVKVGIYSDNSNKVTQSIVIESNQGVDANIVEGQVIEL